MVLMIFKERRKEQITKEKNNFGNVAKRRFQYLYWMKSNAFKKEEQTCLVIKKAQEEYAVQKVNF